MDDLKISVLVPVYNASGYLRECLESLKKQTLKEMEFLLVNDGSTDESLQIMKEYEKVDARFVILNKKNTGYGDSLNKAMKLAKGKYIGIVEPDDYCDEKMFEVLYKMAENKEVNIAKGNYYEYREGIKVAHEMGLAVSGEKVFEPIWDYKVFYEVPAIWSAIYRKDMIERNEITFLATPGASYQDTGFNIKTLACAEKVVYTDKPLYYYRMDNPGSSVKDVKKVMAVVKEYEEIEKFICRRKDRDLLMKYCQVAKFGGYHWNLLRLSKKEAKKFITRMKREFVEKKKKGNIEKKYFPKKYWISLNLLLRVPVGLYWALLSLEKTGKGVIIKHK